MDILNVLFGLMYLPIGLLLIALCWPLIKKKVGVNPFYGVRLSKTMDSEKNWYLANEYFGRKMLPWAVLLLIMGGLAFLMPFENGTVFILYVVLAPLIIVVPVVQTLLYVRHLE